VTRAASIDGLQHNKGQPSTVIFGFILSGHCENVDEQWHSNQGGHSYGRGLGCEKNDCIVYTLDLKNKQIRCRVNAGADVVLHRNIRVSHGTRYKLAMSMGQGDSVTVTQLHATAAQLLQAMNAEMKEKNGEVYQLKQESVRQKKAADAALKEMEAMYKKKVDDLQTKQMQLEKDNRDIDAKLLNKVQEKERVEEALQNERDILRGVEEANEAASILHTEQLKKADEKIEEHRQTQANMERERTEAEAMLKQNAESVLQALQTRFERLRANCIIDTSNYAEWDHDDVSDWLVSLDKGAYEKYESVLRERLAEVNMSGIALLECTKDALAGYGVKQKAHRDALMHHIYALEHK